MVSLIKVAAAGVMAGLLSACTVVYTEDDVYRQHVSRLLPSEGNSGSGMLRGCSSCMDRDYQRNYRDGRYRR
jgi:hypothetical protein